MPLAFKTIHGHLGIIPCLETAPTPVAIGSARSFLKNHSKSKVIIAGKGLKMRDFGQGLIALPYTQILG